MSTFQHVCVNSKLFKYKEETRALVLNVICNLEAS